MSILWPLIFRPIIIVLLTCVFVGRYFRLSVREAGKSIFRNLQNAILVRGNIDRAWFGILGLFLATLKFSFDFALGNYLTSRSSVFPIAFFSHRIPSTQAELFNLLPALLLALPFMWIGIGLLVLRLRDAGFPRWLSVLFFFPIVNYFFFLILCIFPSSRQPSNDLEESMREKVARFLPANQQALAALAIVITSLIGTLGVLIGAYTFKNYGGALFLGLPFCMGLICSLLAGVHTPRSFTACMAISVSATILTAVLLVCFMIEGIICVAALFPIALLLSTLGALVGYVIQMLKPSSKSTLQCCSFLLLALIGGMAIPVSPSSILSSTTTIEINAAPQKVWQHVIAFSKIKAPHEWLFLKGLAYPVQARIEGHGVGAIRYCEFSTGPFVEPITVWDEPRELRFSVTETPPALEEWNPFGKVIAPHLDGYFLSHGGQFLLDEFVPGKTRITATTWYSHLVAPEWYWQLWSDPILHLIHKRVLEHIKTKAESVS